VWPKVRAVLVTEKNSLASSYGTTVAISPTFWAIAHLHPSRIFHVSSESVQIWADITEKILHDPQSKCNIG